MSYTGSVNGQDSFFANVEKERLAIWQAHPHWSERRRAKAWSKRKAQFVSYLTNDDSTPRQLKQELGGSFQSLAQGAGHERGALDIPGAWNGNLLASDIASAVPMSRSHTSKSSYLSNMSTPSSSELQHDHSSTGHRTQLQTAEGYSSSYTYGTANWPSDGDSSQPQQLNEVVFAPAEYFSKLNCSSDHSQVTAQQRIEGFKSSSLAPCSYNTSPSTSISSNLSPFAFTASEAMSRQSSMTSNSVVDGVGMLRVGSSFSAYSDLPFSLDEEQEQLDASFLSCTTEKPSSSMPTTDCYDESNLLSNVGHGFVGLQEPFLSQPSSSIAAVTSGQGCDQDMSASFEHGEVMHRTTSNQSNSSGSSVDIKASQRLQKHIENGNRPIASKMLPAGPLSIEHANLDSKVRPLRPQEPGTKRKEPITKQPYHRRQHPKLLCEICDEYPEGFRGEHELRRHHDRKHVQRRKVWICVDPHVETVEGWRPQRPLAICKQCMHHKQYNVYYNAAAHLRRAHFFPRKRGRKAKGEKSESRGGKAGGNFPPIDWLKNTGFLMEIEVGPESQSSIDFSMDDDDEDYDGLESLPPNPEIELHHDNLSAHALGFPTYPIPTDFCYSYDLDCSMQWSATCFPQAPPMEHTNSAPPVLMTTINDYSNLYIPHDLSFNGATQF